MLLLSCKCCTSAFAPSNPSRTTNEHLKKATDAKVTDCNNHPTLAACVLRHLNQPANQRPRTTQTLMSVYVPSKDVMSKPAWGEQACTCAPRAQAD
jgi:hypothetical protein